MSNDQSPKTTPVSPNYLTPILFISSPQAEQKGLTQEFLQEHLDWTDIKDSPHLTWINQDKTTITIEEIRHLIGELAYASHLGKRRAFVLLAADLLSTPAQHALLKSLEEPPVNTQIILVTAHPRNLLPTIHSRLLKHYQPGWATPAELGSSTETIPETLLTLITDSDEISYQALIKLAQEYKDREQAQGLLNNLLLQLTHGQPLSQKLSLGRLIKIQRQLTTTMIQLQKNLNVRLALEACFFQLKELKTN